MFEITAMSNIPPHLILQPFAAILSNEVTVVNLLEGIREFWGANKDFWFSHAPIPTWPLMTVPYTDTAATNMSLLLQYDQVYRHPSAADNLTNPATTQTTNKRLAFRFATALALKMLHDPTQWSALETWERVFVLLALRHNDSLPLKTLALRKTLEAAEAAPSDPLLARFLQATVWNVHECRERVVGYPVEPMDSQRSLSPLQTTLPYQHLLQAPQTITQATATTTTTKATEERLCLAFRDVLSTSKRIAVSISGGVDSMVAAYVAKKVATRLGVSLILLHIDYGNRTDECPLECQLLRDYAARLGVPLYIRHITDIQRVRHTDLRTVYESVTRRIRFAFYRHFDCPVILGHNLDDCYENVFANLGKQIHFENLFGMSAVGQEDGVAVLRPMLDIPKHDILEFADATGIPHLYDSTPAWSRRGQMRDRLIPDIVAFDPAILGGLQAFVKHTVALEKQWSLSFKRWWEGVSGASVSSTVVTIPRDSFLEENRGRLDFWIRVWQQLSVMGWPRPSNKSLRNFMEALEAGRGRVCNLSGRVRVEIGEGCLVFRLT